MFVVCRSQTHAVVGSVTSFVALHVCPLLYSFLSQIQLVINAVVDGLAGDLLANHYPSVQWHCWLKVNVFV